MSDSNNPVERRSQLEEIIKQSIEAHPELPWAELFETPMTTQLMESLTRAESYRLQELEGVIREHRKGFMFTGTALAEISERKLYRTTHKTFEAYCSEVWDISQRHAYRMIEASEAVAGLPEKCDQLVTNEAQARELAAVPKAKREKVIKKAAAVAEKTGEPITAKAIAEVAEKVLAPVEKNTPVEKRTDRFGHVINPEILEDWDRGIEWARQAAADCQRIKLDIERGLNAGDKVFRGMNNGHPAVAHDLMVVCKLAKPHTVCLKCHGHKSQREKCGCCKTRGWVDSYVYTKTPIFTKLEKTMWEAKAK